MDVRVGDMFQALLRRTDAEGNPEGSEPIELYRMQILSIDGESIIYRREGGESGEVTRSILQAAVDRGDVVKVTEHYPG